MNPKVQLASYVLWYLHPALQLMVAAFLFWRKQRKEFPVFFAYIAAQVLISLVLFPVYQWGSYPVLFYTYWTSTAISVALGFKVIHEVFLDVFRPYHTLKDLGSLLFKWAALVMLLVAGVVAAASPASSDGPLVQAVLTVQRCVRVIQVGLILFLLTFSKYLGVSWRQQSFGIALGFGSFASIELLVVALHTSGHVSQAASSLTNMAAYNCGILIWLAYAVAKKQPRIDASATPLMSQRWEQSLTDLQHPVPADSLIPMFESMVDRALSRSATASAGSGAAQKSDLPSALSPQLPSKN